MSSVTWFSVTVRAAWVLYHVVVDVISDLVLFHRACGVGVVCHVLVDVISDWVLCHRACGVGVVSRPS